MTPISRKSNPGAVG